MDNLLIIRPIVLVETGGGANNPYRFSLSNILDAIPSKCKLGNTKDIPLAIHREELGGLTTSNQVIHYVVNPGTRNNVVIFNSGGVGTQFHNGTIRYLDGRRDNLPTKFGFTEGVSYSRTPETFDTWYTGFTRLLREELGITEDRVVHLYYYLIGHSYPISIIFISIDKEYILYSDKGNLLKKPTRELFKYSLELFTSKFNLYKKTPMDYNTLSKTKRQLEEETNG